MAAWLNLLLLVGVSRVTQIVLGLIATVIGMAHARAGNLRARWRCPAAAHPQLPFRG